MPYTLNYYHHNLDLCTWSALNRQWLDVVKNYKTGRTSHNFWIPNVFDIFYHVLLHLHYILLGQSQFLLPIPVELLHYLTNSKNERRLRWTSSPLATWHALCLVNCVLVTHWTVAERGLRNSVVQSTCTTHIPCCLGISILLRSSFRHLCYSELKPIRF